MRKIMDRDFWAVGVVTVIVLSLAACMSNETAQPPAPAADSACETPSLACADARLAELISEEGEVTYRGERWHVDGVFSHLLVSISYPSSVSDKLAIMARGELLSIDEAELEFEERHRERWGALSISAARYVIEHPDEPRGFALWYDPEVISPEQLEAETLAGLEPDVVDFEPYVASFEATGEQVHALRFVDGIERIGTDGDEPARPYQPSVSGGTSAE